MARPAGLHLHSLYPPPPIPYSLSLRHSVVRPMPSASAAPDGCRRSARASGGCGCAPPPPALPAREGAGDGPRSRPAVTCGGRSSGSDDGAARQHGGALDRVLQLAHVARPGVARAGARRCRRDRRSVAAELACRAREELLGERGDVLAPLAQGRQRERDHVEAVEEVLAEACPRGSSSARSRLVAASMRTSTGDRLGARRAGGSRRSWSARRSLTCSAGRHLADLVEEQGAAVGLLEEARLVGDRARERAAHVAEQLRLQQRLGDAPRSSPPRTGRAARGRRGGWPCAMTSLPVPDSPWMSTVASVGATRSTSSRTLFIAGDCATRPVMPYRARSWRRRFSFSRRSARSASALSMR